MPAKNPTTKKATPKKPIEKKSTPKKSLGSKTTTKKTKNLGNQFWKARRKHGRNLKYETPTQLKNGCESYFQWVEENPLYEEKVFQYEGNIVTHNITKMHAMTLSGLCLHLGITDDTWRNYKKKKDFLGVITWAELVMKTQKFTGAAANLLNANIISRDLGLTDNIDLSSKDGTMTPKGFNDFYSEQDVPTSH